MLVLNSIISTSNNNGSTHNDCWFYHIRDTVSLGVGWEADLRRGTGVCRLAKGMLGMSRWLKVRDYLELRT